jgi:AraC family transcriptional regulator, ethanolamine operon transcriptional activator
MHSLSATGWHHEYTQLEPGPFVATNDEAWLGPVQLVHENVAQPFHYSGRPWEGARIFVSHRSSCGDLHYNRRVLPTSTLVSHRWDSVDRVMCNSSLDLVLIAVDEKLLIQHYEDATDRRCSPDMTGAMLLTRDPRSVDRFSNCTLDVLRQVIDMPAVLLHAQARKCLQAHVINTLVDILDDSANIKEKLPAPSTRSYIVNRAIDLIDTRLGESIGLSEICRLIRVSPRTLRYSFEDVVGVSPMRYIIARRLNCVRNELLQRRSTCNIQDVAFRWGFWHLGRFARFYRQTFGELPSDTNRMSKVSD